MVGHTKPASKAQKRRFRILGQEIGCMCCRMLGQGFVPAEIHHITRGGRRLGHDFTIPLCGWHHRGVGINRFGASIADGRKLFEEFWGNEFDLLDDANRLLAEYEARTVGRSS
jgi:hypothetical protein